MAEERVWYVVFNGTRVRILRGLAPPDAPATTEITMQSAGRKLRNSITAATGTAETTGDRYGPTEDPDPLRQDSRRFIGEVVRTLTSARAAGDFDRLVVIGSPDAMRLWREEVPPGLAEVVAREEMRNLVRLPGRKLIAAIRALSPGQD